MAPEKRWTKRVVSLLVPSWSSQQPQSTYLISKPGSASTWLEDSIKAGHIIYFDYSEFKVIKQIGKGGYGTVEYAEWKNTDQEVALKSLNTDEPQINEESLKEFVNELDLLRKVSFHPNINRFYGVTKGIPQDFVKLYDRCWEENPEDRPDIEEVINILESISQDTASLPVPVKILEEKLEIRESPPSNGNLYDQSDNVSVPQTLYTSSMDHSEVDLNVSNSAVSTMNSHSSSDNSNITFETFYDATTSSSSEENTESTTSLSEHSAQASVLLDEITGLYIEQIKIGSIITKNKFDRWIVDHKENLENILHYLIINKNVIQHGEVMVGKFFERGFGTEMNKKESLDCFKRASEKGDIYGHYNVGYCYYRDFGNYEQATEYFELAVKKGLLSKAKYMLGIMKNNGYGTDKDVSTAFALFKEAAENGYVPAQYWLAVFYLEGTGTKQNEPLALEWFRKCVDSGGYEDAEKKITDLCKH
ncbi:10580_t:CDS:2 [Acaulospora morrowiae]|uniref:10580_t:CDS:1 n=1 Tax=Acaulospora morrowiae TaxID=94023 RepID=A0A9N8VQJ1_9GLOM|nr:10580_t:CDS:2 [Acaulospora morrowiae]